MLDFIKNVLRNMPAGWLTTTTHRLDIYDEKLAKVQFLEKFEDLFERNVAEKSELDALPTAYDYVRLGHPLSCVLEWVIARSNDVDPENVISFSSQTIPLLAVLRKNLLDNKKTRIVSSGELPSPFDADTLRNVYGYTFELEAVQSLDELSAYDGSTVFVSQTNGAVELNPHIDFFVSLYPQLGSILLVNGEKNKSYIPAIQHVRRRETIAMTPANSLAALTELVGESLENAEIDVDGNKALVAESIKEIAGVETTPLIGSSGLSIQYAILMGLVDDALENHPGKEIRIIVPPNCYGGTNDQARRVAACIENVQIVDLPVDGGNDMVKGIDKVLGEIANEGAVPFIIAEIPTNPRVEVPDLVQLRDVLTAERKNSDGENAVEPVFVLDQTFCPNVRLLGEGEMLSAVRCISFASGSKFPSGGLCTAGYCVGNDKTAGLVERIGKHLRLCDNEATDLQMEVLANQLPSMKKRIRDAYENTREFVDFVMEKLPTASINFVSEELADRGFTPSVFSLDLPTQGDTAQEKEAYKRKLNLKLINLMISRIPTESKYCVSYGQLKGCYWTVPATSTQGTTKEGDKDYIVRVALSPKMDLALHKKVFLEFVESL